VNCTYMKMHGETIKKASDLVCYMQEVQQIVYMILFTVEQMKLLSGAQYFPGNLFQ